MEIRLQKWLSQAGIASRRKAEELIKAGHVAVNGTVITELGARADTSRDRVTVKGRLCEIDDIKIYIAFHKPEGVVTTVSDPFNRPTVMDFIPKDMHCFPVGRLDYDTAGLLILTNDGEFAELLAHPRHEMLKTYIATVKSIPDKNSMDAFRSGLFIDGRRTAPCEIEIVNREPNVQICIRLCEGRNRQVRKMCEAIGHPVMRLKRVEIGPIKLEGLVRGKWRYLTDGEVQAVISGTN